MSDVFRLKTPYDLLHEASLGIIEFGNRENPDPEEIVGKLVELDMFLSGFSIIDFQVNRIAFDIMVQDLSRCFARFCPVWPHSFSYFIFLQLQGIDADLDDYIVYMKGLVELNRKPGYNWNLAQMPESPILMVFNLDNQEVAHLFSKIEDKEEIHIPDDFLDHFASNN